MVVLVHSFMGSRGMSKDEVGDAWSWVGYFETK